MKQKIIAITLFILFIGVNLVHPTSGFRMDLANNLKTTSSPIDVPEQITLESLQITTRLATKTDIQALKTLMGTYDPAKEYTMVYDGHGTGLIPPTEMEWDAMIDSMSLVDTFTLPGKLRESVDLSTEPFFPEVRDQGVQHSCVGWATGYYNNGYLQAKQRGWMQASTGNNSQLLSPAFIYNKAHGGKDEGSQMFTGLTVQASLGVCREEFLPYDQDTIISWGDETAWRDAPTYRINQYNVITPNYNYPYYTDTDITLIKSILSSGHPLNFAINASSYSGLGVSDDTITSNEIVPNTNHAQTIVGYDNTKTVGGEVGAFKVVNSWGKTWGSAWNGNGYYWITYEAYKKINDSPTYYFDIRYTPFEHPQLLVIMDITAGTRDTSVLSVGLGPFDTLIMFWNRIQPFTLPSFMCFDITGFYDEWITGATDFSLHIARYYKAAGVDIVIKDIFIEYHKEGYTPKDPYWITQDFLPGTQTIKGPTTLPMNFPLVYNLNQERLYQTITEALDNAVDGDIIEVYPGTYYEPTLVIDKSVTLLARDDEKTIINSTGYTAIDITASNVTLVGFTIEGPTYYYGYAVHISANKTVLVGNTILNSNYGVIIKGNNNVVSNNSIGPVHHSGIFLLSGTDNVISGNNITGASYGIYIDKESSNNLISANNVYQNTDSGIFLFGYIGVTSNNIVSDNKMYQNKQGIFTNNACGNLIIGNTMVHNEDGALFLTSYDNIITQNTIKENTKYGIYLNGSGNTLYHNNFINNTWQASNSGSNTWSLSYPFTSIPYGNGGNYWSDHITTDEYKGPNQDQSGSDGICDLGSPSGGIAPYTFISGGIDSYPFISENEWYNWYWGYGLVHVSDTSETYHSLQEAINSASAGSIIWVDAGVLYQLA